MHTRRVRGAGGMGAHVVTERSHYTDKPERKLAEGQFSASDRYLKNLSHRFIQSSFEEEPPTL